MKNNLAVYLTEPLYYSDKYIVGCYSSGSFHIINKRDDTEHYQETDDFELTTGVKNKLVTIIHQFELAEGYYQSCEILCRRYKLYKEYLQRLFVLTVDEYIEEMFKNRIINIPYEDKEEVRILLHNFFTDNAVAYLESIIADCERKLQRKIYLYEQSKNARTKKLRDEYAKEFKQIR